MGKIRLVYVLFGTKSKDLERIKDVFRGTTVRVFRYVYSTYVSFKSPEPLTAPIINPHFLPRRYLIKSCQHSAAIDYTSECNHC
jgi:hypothetical protein